MLYIYIYIDIQNELVYTYKIIMGSSTGQIPAFGVYICVYDPLLQVEEEVKKFMESVHAKIALVNKTIGLLEAPYNPSPNGRHAECHDPMYIKISQSMTLCFLTTNSTCKNRNIFCLRMVKDLESTMKKMEHEYGGLAKLAGSLSLEDEKFDKEGLARFFVLYGFMGMDSFAKNDVELDHCWYAFGMIYIDECGYNWLKCIYYQKRNLSI